MVVLVQFADMDQGFNRNPRAATDDPELLDSHHHSIDRLARPISHVMQQLQPNQ